MDIKCIKAKIFQNFQPICVSESDPTCLPWHEYIFFESVLGDESLSQAEADDLLGWLQVTLGNRVSKTKVSKLKHSTKRIMFM